MKTGRILLVDDDPGLTTLFRIVLEREGYTVQSTNDGESAVRLARHFKPDLVLLDYNLPGITGAEIAQLFSLDQELAGTRIVYLTGEAPADRGHLSLRKPILPRTLAAAVEAELSEALAVFAV